MAQNGTGKSNFFNQVDGDSAGSFQPEKVSCPALEHLPGLTAFHLE